MSENKKFYNTVYARATVKSTLNPARTMSNGRSAFLIKENVERHGKVATRRMVMEACEKVGVNITPSEATTIVNWECNKATNDINLVESRTEATLHVIDLSGSLKKA